MEEIKYAEIGKLLTKIYYRICNERITEKNKFVNVLLEIDKSIDKSFDFTFRYWARYDELMNYGRATPPRLLGKEENGVFTPQLVDGKEIYGYDDREIKFYESISIFLFERLNLKTDVNLKVMESVVKERKWTSITTGKTYDVSNICMLVATVFPDGEDYDTVPVDEDYLSRFERYKIVE